MAQIFVIVSFGGRTEAVGSFRLMVQWWSSEGTLDDKASLASAGAARYLGRVVTGAESIRRR